MTTHSGILPIAAILCVFLSSCADPPASFKEPPPDSYAARTYQVQVGETIATVNGALITPEFFSAAGLRPLVGRFPADADRSAGATPVVILSHDLWAERFGKEPAIIGRELEIDGVRMTVIGIALPRFSFPDAAMLWTVKRHE